MEIKGSGGTRQIVFYGLIYIQCVPRKVFGSAGSANIRTIYTTYLYLCTQTLFEQTVYMKFYSEKK